MVRPQSTAKTQVIEIGHACEGVHEPKIEDRRRHHQHHQLMMDLNRYCLLRTDGGVDHAAPGVAPPKVVG